MTTATAISAELRKLADAIEHIPMLMELPRPEIEFRCKYIGPQGKSMFLELARVFPRPFAKGPQQYDEEGGFEIRYTADALIATAVIERSKVCKMIEPEKIIPAVYDCEPLLSESELQTL
jgi:hypothetical protein